MHNNCILSIHLTLVLIFSCHCFRTLVVHPNAELINHCLPKPKTFSYYLTHLVSHFTEPHFS